MLHHRFIGSLNCSGTSAAAGGAPYELYRVYVFSDSDCVNLIYRGAIVGGDPSSWVECVGYFACGGPNESKAAAAPRPRTFWTVSLKA